MDSFCGQGCRVQSISRDTFVQGKLDVTSGLNEGIPILVNLFNSSRLRLVKPGASRRDEARIISRPSNFRTEILYV